MKSMQNTRKRNVINKCVWPLGQKAEVNQTLRQLIEESEVNSFHKTFKKKKKKTYFEDQFIICNALTACLGNVWFAKNFKIVYKSATAQKQISQATQPNMEKDKFWMGTINLSI